MALIENTLFGEKNKVEMAIQRLKAFEPKEGYYLCFSGGKDSQCVYHLAKQGGVRFDAHYSITSVDPPELVRFIKKNYPDVHLDFPRDSNGKVITMWNLIPRHTIPPTRMARYCCAELKETGGKGRLVVTGVRWAESPRRKALHGVANVQTKSKKIIDDAMERSLTAKLNDRGGLIMNDDNDENRRTVEHCYRTKKTMINPIVDWTDEEVWEYLNEWVKVPHCSLYDEGFKRIGCIGCPLSGADNMRRDFLRWPKYKEAYIRAFDRMIKNHPGEIRIATGEPAETGGASLQDGFGGTLDPSTENYDLVLDKHGVVMEGGQVSSNGSTSGDKDSRLVDSSPLMTALAGGQTSETTRLSNGGSNKSEIQRHRRVVSNKVGSCPRNGKSVHKGDYIYTLAELNGRTLLDAYVDWNGKLIWATAHSEGYTPKDRNAIQFEDFD